MAPVKSSRAMVVRTPTCVAPSDGMVESLVKMSVKFTEPNVQKASSTPTVKPKSPMRVTMKAFFPASAADFFRNQKPISK